MSKKSLEVIIAISGVALVLGFIALNIIAFTDLRLPEEGAIMLMIDVGLAALVNFAAAMEWGDKYGE